MQPSIINEDLRYITAAELPWSDFAKKTVLVTGANGLLAACMVEALLFLNERFGFDLKVVGVVRNPDKAFKRFSRYSTRPDFTLITQDVCLPLSNLADIHYIIHAASQATPAYYESDPVGTLGANILGTHHLLELARRKNSAGFLYFSSGEVYGEIPDDQMLTTEDDYGYIDPTEVRNCYGESKRMAENMCVSFYHQYRVPSKIVRPFHTYGPGMNLNDGRVFSDFVSDIVHDRNIEMLSDGSAIRAFCYLADAVIGYFTVLLKGQNGEAYNVGTDRETSVLELANILVGFFPEKNLKVIKKEYEKPEENIRITKRGIIPDISKIKQLGWTPSISIESGFKRTIESYLEEKRK